MGDDRGKGHEYSSGGEGASMAEPRALDERTSQRLAEFFGGLADPTRARLIGLLVAHELCVGDLAAALDMSMSAISHQLALLRRLHIVRRRRQGRHVYYAVDDAHVAAIYVAGLDHIGHRPPSEHPDRAPRRGEV